MKRPRFTLEEIRQWLPNQNYYERHLERLTFSFNNLPDLPRGFSCVSIGSWGAEAPFLVEVLGASRVVCIRAPADGAPAYVASKVRASASTREVSIELIALNAEREVLSETLKDFDLCLNWEILEHLFDDPSFFLWQSIQLLRIGGYLSLTSPNALWHYYTTAQLFGENALGLRLQPHIPFATHWRLYSPKEVDELSSQMGCETRVLTTFLKTEPFSWKSRLFLFALKRMREKSGNGVCSEGQHIYFLSQKVADTPVWRPPWLFPATNTEGRDFHITDEVS